MKSYILIVCIIAGVSAHAIDTIHHHHTGSDCNHHTHSSSQHIPIIGSEEVPVKTPEVQNAKALHFAKLAQAKAESFAHNPTYAPTYTHEYTGPQHIPVIGPNGVPIDTPEVQQATAEHLHQKAEVHARNGDYLLPVVPYEAHNIHHETIPVEHTYTGPLHIPIIDSNGVPVETAEVQQAKAEHFAQKVEAEVRNGDLKTTVVSTPVLTKFTGVKIPVVTKSTEHLFATKYADSAPHLTTSNKIPVVNKPKTFVATTYSSHGTPVAYKTVPYDYTYTYASPIVNVEYN